MRKTLQNPAVVNSLLAAAFGALATVVGVTASGHPLPIALLAMALVGFYYLAEAHGWLLKDERPGRRHDAVTLVFSILVALFVLATGGAHSPLWCALYLPVLLAALCYNARLGLSASAMMAVVYGFFACGGRWHGWQPSWNDVAVGLSFPLMAVFARLLISQTEERLRALHSQTRALYSQTRDLSALLDMSQKMLDMSQMMDAAADLDTTLNLLLLNVQRLTDCPVCAVYMKQPAADELQLRAASGRRERLALLPSLPVADARSGAWSLAEAVQAIPPAPAFYAPDTAQRPARRGDAPLFRLDPHAASFGCFPLTSMEGLLGMLYVGYDHPDGLDEEVLRGLEILAVRAGFALQRAVLQQDVQTLAYSDAMTGLPNFRQFEFTLNEEMRRAERYNRQVSLLLLDIDHFKKFNDTLGHQAGDALLAQLATVLQGSLRGVDEPARYGGEEFVVVCPETGPDEARLIAERIRRSVEGAVFLLAGEGDAAPRPCPVTVSVGYATFPQDARADHDLVQRADAALYAAKGAGRNCVRGASESRVPLSAA